MEHVHAKLQNHLWHTPLDVPEPLYTTVDQAFREGTPFDAVTIPKGKSIVNGGFRYCNLGDAPMTAEAKTVTGALKCTNIRSHRKTAVLQTAIFPFADDRRRSAP